MKKYENFCASLKNMKEIYTYEEPYNTVVLTGLVGLYEICFEQSWKMMKEMKCLNLWELTNLALISLLKQAISFWG